MCVSTAIVRSTRIVQARPAHQPETFPVFALPSTRDPSSDSARSSPASQVETQIFPWWPELDTAKQIDGNTENSNQTEPVYLSSTQLPDGRLSIIIDPGAWTNLIGSDLARKLVTRALETGLSPKQTNKYQAFQCCRRWQWHSHMQIWTTYPDCSRTCRRLGASAYIRSTNC